MDHRFQVQHLQRKRSSRSVRGARDFRQLGFDLVSDGWRCQGEIGSRRWQDYVSKNARDTSYSSDSSVEENFVSPESSDSVPTISMETRRKAFTDNEIQKEKKIQKSSPSIIARLMGIDPLPPSQTHKRLKEPRRSPHSASPADVQNNLARNNEKFHQAIQEPLEFKDVFEIQELPKTAKHQDHAKKEMPFDNLKRNPPHSASFITILKASNNTNQEHDDLCLAPDLKEKKFSASKKCFVNSFPSGEPVMSVSDDSLMEYYSFLSQPRRKSAHEDRREDGLSPSEIVLLKPIVEKGWDPEKSNLPRKIRERFQSVEQMPQNSWRTPMQDSYSFHSDPRRSFCFGADVTKTNVTREVSGGIEKQLTSASGRRSLKLSASRFESHIGDGRSFERSMSNYKYVKAYDKIYDNDAYFNCHRPFSSSSAEVSMNRQARRHLSETWKMSHRYGIAEYREHSKSPFEMLLLFDKGTSKSRSRSSSTRNVSSEKMTQGCAPNFHQDRWIEGCNIHLPTSRNFASSSDVHGLNKLRNKHLSGHDDDRPMSNGTFKQGNRDPLDRYFDSIKTYSYQDLQYEIRNPQYLGCHGCENRLSTVNMGSFRDVSTVKSHNGSTEVVEDATNEAMELFEDISVPSCKDVKIACLAQRSDEVSGSRCSTVTVEDLSSSHSAVDLVSSRHVKMELRSTGASEARQLRSFLQHFRLEEENRNYFQGVGSDIQGSQIPLQDHMLVSEDNEALVVGHDDSLGGLLQAFRNEEDRDFSYVIDVLIDSRICGVNQDELLISCYSPQFPADPNVFKKLEKKYSVLESWPESERRLLFDLVNYAVSEILSTSMGSHPWSKKRKLSSLFSHEVIAEDIWQMVVRLRRELSSGNPQDKVLDQRWLESGQNFDLVGGEIADMLKEELLKELVREFLPV